MWHGGAGDVLGRGVFDHEARREIKAGVTVVLPARNIREYVWNISRRVDCEIVGTVPWYPEMRNHHVAKGRFFTDLDMDFASLQRRGFRFVKLDATVFLDGLPAPSGPLPAADICRHFADLGLSLIVGQIDDEWVAAEIMGLGVVYGQGVLFGAPRPVKAEVVETAH